MKRIQSVQKFPAKPTKAYRGEDDIFIYLNRPVENIDWKTSKDIIYVNVFKPTVVPTINIGEQSVILHNHTPFDRCLRSRFCHQLGYVVPDQYSTNFDRVWGYLYNPVQPVVSGSFNLGFH